MKRSCFGEEQIISILKEYQARLVMKELCRKHGISDASFYKQRSKFGGIEVSDARRLKTLETEKPKLNKVLADQMMDVATLKEMLAKKPSKARLMEESGGLGDGLDRSACLQAQIEAAGGYRTAGQDERVGP